jgi:hypothetical protein
MLLLRSGLARPAAHGLFVLHQFYWRRCQPSRSGTDVSGLHQLDADPIGRRDISQQASANPSLQLDRKGDTLCPQLGTERPEITLIHEAKMVDPAGVMARKVGEVPYWPRIDRCFARALAANEDRHATQIDKNLRGARATVLALIVAPNISAYHFAEASGSWLMI